MACSCRSRRDNIKSVTTVNTATIRLASDNSLAAEIASKRLDLLSTGYSDSVPKKVRELYEKVCNGADLDQKEIIIRLCRLGESGTDSLCRVLPFYTNLQHLTLWKTQLTTKAIVRLCSSLEVMEHLQVLGLEDNGLKDDSILCLVRVFKLLKNLKELWLSANEITIGGAQVLSSSLTDLPELELLNLDFNYIGNAGCKSLCKALIARHRLRVLSLRGNLIDSEATADLVMLGNSNPPVERLDLQSNFLSSSDCETLKTVYDIMAILTDQREKPGKK